MLFKNLFLIHGYVSPRSGETNQGGKEEFFPHQAYFTHCSLPPLGSLGAV